jgi:cytohesin
MKHLLLTTIAAVVLVGCGESQQSTPAPETKPVEPVAEVPSQPSPPPVEGKPTEPVAEAAKPEPPTAKAPDISIHEAAYNGNIETVKQHIAAGTDVNAVDDKGWSVLDNALASKNEELINFVKTTGGNSNADKSIFIASGVGALEAVKQYITAGTDVNTKDAFGTTPLLLAIFNGHKEIAELLIANGADVNAKHDLDASTPLHKVALFGEKEIIELLIAAGADVNAKGSWGGTPLNSAAYWGHKEVAELLIAGGAEVNAKDNWGYTPLHQASFKVGGHKEVAELLIGKGADVNAKDELGETPLDWAIKRLRTETADLLRKHGGKTGEELKAEGK